MGSNINDKWLGKLRDSVENYSEPLPDGFWEDIKASVPVAAAANPKMKSSGRFLWTLAAAAVLLLGIVLLLPQDKEPVNGELALAVMAEEDVVRLFEAEGAAAFPCMTVDGLISWAGSYPANEQVLCEAEVQLDFCGSGDDNPCASCGRCSGRS
jgi:hypothetical protein